MNLARGKMELPLYIQLSELISAQIMDGTYTTGDIIPSEKQLEALYSVSRMTVRQAVTELVSKGYLEKMRGIGTVVTYGKIQENLMRVISFTEEMQQHNIKMETGFCEIKAVRANEKVAASLNIPDGSSVYELKRVRFANNKPLVFSTSYLNVVNLPLDPNSYVNSLYKLLHDEYEVTISRGIDVLEATLADEVISKHLEISQELPVFKRTRTAYDTEDKIIEYTVSFYPGDKYRYSVNL